MTIVYRIVISILLLCGSSMQHYHWRGSCENVRCSRGKVCRMRQSAPRCICNPDCSLDEMSYTGRVCGSDNKSYRNLCRLRKYNCRHARHVEVQYYGKCRSSCESVTCLNGRHCLLDQNHTPHCVPCRLKCPPAQPNQQICGSDGNTYDSLCKVRAAMCLRGKSIAIAYKGPCIPALTCETITCPPDRVCLTDTQTGQPHCASCNARHYCAPFLETKTICGTDDVTYQSWCEMKIASCAQGIVIETKKGGSCGSNEAAAEFQPVYDDIHSDEDDESYYFALR
ncbi:follistatin-like isoform X2 [Lineus longissimus]|uniref:follistatin-like isoform X2 n=1 Tax=Lineus longissimus TaxID=88925 RepID=UPI00315D9FE0